MTTRGCCTAPRPSLPDAVFEVKGHIVCQHLRRPGTAITSQRSHQREGGGSPHSETPQQVLPRVPALRTPMALEGHS